MVLGTNIRHFGEWPTTILGAPSCAVTSQIGDATLTPECLRRVGALAVLCSWYGCTAIFASDRVLEDRLSKSLGL